MAGSKVRHLLAASVCLALLGPSGAVPQAATLSVSKLSASIYGFDCEITGKYEEMEYFTMYGPGLNLALLKYVRCCLVGL